MTDTAYVSTRGGDQATLTEALLRGLARDGGLYVPARLGRFRDERPTGALTELAAWAARSLFAEVDRAVLEAVVADALDFPIPLREVERGVHVLELFHGPTHAFKDVGARFLARLAVALDPVPGRRVVLVATSGDTGGAVAAAFHGVPGFQVVALFPRDGVSERQRRQMTTLGGNVHAVAVDGPFDACQRMVKEAFRDASLADRHRLTSANSINVGRLLPQVIYYLHASAQLGWPASPRFVVPSGNLGNLCAGLIAHRMGMPAAGFVAAANANRGWVDFLSGAPLVQRPTLRTQSNAMDVGAPSNAERILWLYDDDLDGLRSDVTGISVSDEEAAARIRDVHARTGYVLDPHSAVAYEAAIRNGAESTGPTVVLATAHPAKFPEVTERVTGLTIPLPPGLARGAKAEERLTEITPTLDQLAAVLARTEDA